MSDSDLDDLLADTLDDLEREERKEADVKHQHQASAAAVGQGGLSVGPRERNRVWRAHRSDTCLCAGGDAEAELERALTETGLLQELQRAAVAVGDRLALSDAERCFTCANATQIGAGQRH